MIDAVALVLVLSAGQRAWPSHKVEAMLPTPRVVAVVNGVRVTSDRVEAAVNTLLPLESFHQNVSAEKVADLRRRALAQVVDDELLYQYAVTRSIRVKDADVEAAIDEGAARYQSRKAFLDALAKSGASLAELRREVRRRLMIRAALEQQASSSCAVGSAEALRFFEEHPERFVEPERLRIHAITIGVDPSGGESARSAARARAEDVRRQLANGAAFDEMARRFSSDTSGPKGGDMGLVHRGSLSPPFEAVAASLPVGVASQVVESIYGYHIIQITEILLARPRSFQDVGARLQEELSAERCAAVKDAWLSGLRAAATIRYE